jgi:hypothetical protein
MISRRNFLRAGLTGLPLTALGCAHQLPWGAADVYSPQARCTLPTGMPGPQLIAHLNENVRQLTGWRATGAEVSSRGPNGFPMSLKAMLSVEAPRNFRLVVNGPVGGSEFDLGSNDEDCWVWMKRQPRKQVLTCRLDSLDQARRRFPIPFEPDWIMEVLGVMPFDAEQLSVEDQPATPEGKPRVQLVGTHVTPSGVEWRKTTLVDACHGLVLEHAVHDSTDRLVARAVLSGHARRKLPTEGRSYAATGPVMPAAVQIYWPDVQMDLSIVLNDVDVNPTVNHDHFAIPDYPGCERVDLSA